MKKRLLGLFIIVLMVLILSGCNISGLSQLSDDKNLDIDDGGGDINNPETMTKNDWTDLADAYNDLLQEDRIGRPVVKGSCNVIAEKSSCVDYVGSYWENNKEAMDLQCSGVGVRSDNTCPYTDIGGCVNGPGSMTESVVWLYDTGGSPTTQADKPYAQGACDANPLGKWVTPDQYYLEN